MQSHQKCRRLILRAAAYNAARAAWLIAARELREARAAYKALVALEASNSDSASDSLQRAQEERRAYEVADVFAKLQAESHAFLTWRNMTIYVADVDAERTAELGQGELAGVPLSAILPYPPALPR